MPVKSKTVVDLLSPRANPYKMLAGNTYSKDQLKKIAKNMAKLEYEVYKGTALCCGGAEYFLDNLKEEDLKYTAVVYDENNGGSELGPYIAYVLAYSVYPSHDDLIDLFDEADEFVRDLASNIDQSNSEELAKIVKLKRDITSAKVELRSTDKPIIYMNDMVRLRTDFAKSELSQVYSNMMMSLAQTKGYFFGESRQSTSYKVVKRLEASGFLDIMLDLVDPDYFEGEQTHHILLRIK